MIRFLLRQISNVVAISILTSAFFACNPHSERGRVFGQEYYSNGQLKTIAIPRSDGAIQVFSFDTIGNCTDLLTSNGKQMDGDQLWFFPNGMLRQKTRYKLGKPDGFSYQYYSSGAIQNQRFLKNGHEQELGLDYFDMHVPVVKSSLYFNDNGELYFKQNFDSLSNLINEEGNKPKSLQ